MAKKLYTIGYAGFPVVEDFVKVLKKFGIQVLIDVRSSPYSVYYEQYNRDRLSSPLREHDIYYFNYATQFGARQEDKTFYKNGRLDFETFSKSEQFLDGIQKIENSSASIVFMCAEKNPCDCHRAILVARAFSDRGYDITHILPNGEIMTQSDIDRELIEEYFPNRFQQSLFEDSDKSEKEYIAEAYKLRNDEIGFRLEDLK